MIGSVISHYKILEKLGEGGMGIVYKAQDTRLDRIVALKFLPQYLTSNETEKARFLQEAKAASQLNHPNICVIHDIQEIDEKQFIVMEYIDGQTLRKSIDNRQLSIIDCVGFALQIGDALQEAHAKGIVHRDVKSENIMVNSKNQIKVMDFGLAKLKGSVKLTKSSSTTGTLAYMAPEQIQGSEADGRADIFSFGVVLYEMLAGKTPFRGEHEAAMMYSIINEEPQPIQKFRDDISSELLHILNRALEKDPEERYQTVKDMTIDLRRLKKDSTRVVRLTGNETGEKTQSHANLKNRFSARQKFISLAGVCVLAVLAFVFRNSLIPSSPVKNDKKMMVVLPFENLGPGDKSYFVDGMTEEVTSRLSGLSGLGVIARSSAMQYKGSIKTFKQIGDELGVSYILQGTVRWEELNGETHVRVSPSLIKVDDGTQAWSQSMESVLSSAFKLQSDIASKVATALDIALLKSEKQTLEAALTDNAEAYDYYLKAIQYSERDNAKENFEIGIQLLERATQIDPMFAAAYAKLSYIQSNMYWFFYDRSESRIEKSRLAAEKAVQLAPGLSEAREAMGWYFYHGKLDYAGALEQFSIALKYRPSNADVHYGIAAVLRRQGKMTEAAESFRKSIANNPRVSETTRQLGETLTLMRNYEEADRFYDKAIQLSPDNKEGYWSKALNVLLWKGDTREARRFIDDGLRFGKAGEVAEGLNMLSYTVELIDRNFDQAGKALNRITSPEGFSSQFHYAPTSLLFAKLEVVRGNTEKARSYFDNARISLEKKIRNNPADERLYSALGAAYAGLGMKEEAIRAGNRGVELLPVEVEAWRGGYRLMALAEIYARVGEPEKAIDVLERLLSIPADLSGVWLRIHPTWDPLRDNKRFEQLVKKNQ